jgi:hypothetical protein
MISGAAALTHQEGICHGTKSWPSNFLRARQGRCALDVRPTGDVDGILMSTGIGLLVLTVALSPLILVGVVGYHLGKRAKNVTDHNK